MFKTQLEHIQAEKQKAFAIFHATKDKLLSTIERANSHIIENVDKINDKAQEIKALQATNGYLSEHIGEMRESVRQIESIVGGRQ